MKNLLHNPPRWLKISGYILAVLVFFLFTFHLTFNSRNVQQYAKDLLAQRYGVKINWDKLKFNGATGYFSGRDLTVNIPKTGTTLGLKKFSLALDPFSLLFKRVHVIDLNASEINIHGGISEKKIAKPIRPKGNVTETLRRIQVDKGDVQNILVSLPGDKTLSIDGLKIRSRNLFLIYNRGLGLTVSGVQYRSPRLDAFADVIHTNLTMGTAYDFGTGKEEPDINATLSARGLLLGINKRPVPWNPAEAWDRSLNPVLQRYYSNKIPDNRTFCHGTDVQIEVRLASNLIEVRQADIEAFEGKIGFFGKWNRHRGDVTVNLDTPKPIKMSLLPLGKSRFRQSFERARVTLASSGKITKEWAGTLKGLVHIELSGNETVPELSPLVLSSSLKMDEGKIRFPDLKILLGDGLIQGKGHMDMESMNLASEFEGKGFDAQTVVGLFTTLDIPGKVNLSGSIDGELKNPRFDLNLSAEGFGFENLHLGSFKGTLGITDKNFSLTGSSSLGDSGKGMLDLSIEQVFKSSEQITRLKTQFETLPVDQLFESKVLAGNVSGFFNMTKEKASYDGGGDMTISDFLLGQLPVKAISGTLSLKDKRLEVSPLKYIWESSSPPEAVTPALTFDFLPTGVSFKGKVLSGVQVDGEFNNSIPHLLPFKMKVQNVSLRFLAPLLPIDPEKMIASGEFDVDYHMDNPRESSIAGNLTDFQLMGDEKALSLTGETTIEYGSKRIDFHNSSWILGTGRLRIDGSVGIEDESNLKISGTCDLSQFSGLQPWLAEGSGEAGIDLNVTGPIQSPTFDGRVDLKNASLVFVNLGEEMSDTTGQVLLAKNRFTFNQIKMLYGDSPTALNGWIEWDGQQLTAAQLALKSKELSLNKAGSWNVLTDADINLRGSGDDLTLSGSLKVVEGMYYKDYSLSQFVLKPIGVRHEITEDTTPAVLKKMALDLNIKSAGDFEIKNNIAHLILNGNLEIGGTFIEPQITGIVNVQEGEFYALGIKFENTSGFATFAGSKTINPLIEFEATRDIQNYEIKAKINGPSDNLALSLESVPSLDQNDIVSLVAYGRTTDQLTDVNRDIFSTQAVASQVVGLLQRPIEKATRLDVVRLESKYTSAQPTQSRFSIGKQLSDRFVLAFTTDISLEEAYKGVVVEYEIIDDVLLKGTKDTGSRYHFDLTWRFETY